MRAALIQVTADLPAGRVVSGLMSCTAHAGCSRCDKKFKKKQTVDDVNSPDFGKVISKFGQFEGDGLS